MARDYISDRQFPDRKFTNFSILMNEYNRQAENTGKFAGFPPNLQAYLSQSSDFYAKNRTAILSDFYPHTLKKVALSAIREIPAYRTPYGYTQHDLPFGSAIEEVAQGWYKQIKPRLNDTYAQMYAVAPAQTYSIVHPETGSGSFIATVSESELAKAFNSEYGLEKIINDNAKILANSMQAAYTAKFKNLINMAENSGRTSHVYLDLDTHSIDDLLELELAIKNIVSEFVKDPTSKYVCIDIESIDNPDDVIVYIKSDIYNETITKVNQFAFNPEYGWPQGVKIEPLVEFPESLENAYAFVCTRGTLNRGSYPNDASVSTVEMPLLRGHNIILNENATYAYFVFTQTCVISPKPYQITSLQLENSVTNTNVNTVTLSDYVSYIQHRPILTVPDGAYAWAAYSWKIESVGGGKYTGQGVMIDNLGLVTINPDYDGTTFSVTCTSKQDRSKSATIVYTRAWS